MCVCTQQSPCMEARHQPCVPCRDAKMVALLLEHTPADTERNCTARVLTNALIARCGACDPAAQPAWRSILADLLSHDLESPFLQANLSTLHACACALDDRALLFDVLAQLPRARLPAPLPLRAEFLDTASTSAGICPTDFARSAIQAAIHGGHVALLRRLLLQLPLPPGPAVVGSAPVPAAGSAPVPAGAPGTSARPAGGQLTGSGQQGHVSIPGYMVLPPASTSGFSLQACLQGFRLGVPLCRDDLAAVEALAALVFAAAHYPMWRESDSAVQVWLRTERRSSAAVLDDIAVNCEALTALRERGFSLALVQSAAESALRGMVCGTPAADSGVRGIVCRTPYPTAIQACCLIACCQPPHQPEGSHRLAWVSVTSTHVRRSSAATMCVHLCAHASVDILAAYLRATWDPWCAAETRELELLQMRMLEAVTQNPDERSACAIIRLLRDGAVLRPRLHFPPLDIRSTDERHSAFVWYVLPLAAEAGRESVVKVLAQWAPGPAVLLPNPPLARFQALRGQFDQSPGFTVHLPARLEFSWVLNAALAWGAWHGYSLDTMAALLQVCRCSASCTSSVALMLFGGHAGEATLSSLSMRSNRQHRVTTACAHLALPGVGAPIISGYVFQLVSSCSLVLLRAAVRSTCIARYQPTVLDTIARALIRVLTADLPERNQLR